MSKKQRYVLLSLILIIATFLRFYHFTSTPPGLYPDEAMDGNNAVEAAETGRFQVFYPEDNGREGLYVNMIAAIETIHPNYEAWAIRLPAAFAGIMTVLGLYFLVAELFGVEAGLLVAFLLATSVWHIIFSRIGFRAILSPLLLTWSLYLLHKAYRNSSPQKAFWYAISAGIVYGLGFYTYIAYRITPLLFLLFIPFFRTLSDFWKRSVFFILATFGVAAPLGFYFLNNPGSFFGRTAQISVTNSQNPLYDLFINIIKTAAMFNIHGDYNWRQNISGAAELFWPVGLLFILGLILGIYTLVQRTRKKDISDKLQTLFPAFGTILAFAWLILGGLPAIFSDEGIPHALRSILMVVPALLLAALGGLWLYGIIKKHWNPNGAKALAALFFIITTGWAYYDYFIVWGQNSNVAGAFNENYVDIGKQINALPTSTPKYVIVSAGGVLARGIPVPAETTMFVTHSFTAEDQSEEHIHYLLPNEENTIPSSTPSSSIFYIN